LGDWGAGLATGLVVGWIAGLLIGRRQRAWPELSDRQRKLMIGVTAAGVLALAAGIIAFIAVSR
jgi:tetrahydromethanopterin S-methyltransferase subunit F